MRKVSNLAEAAKHSLTLSPTNSKTSHEVENVSSVDEGIVAYLMERLQKNWGSTLSQVWEKAGDRERQKQAYRRLRAEYASVIDGADARFVDDVITLAREQHPEYVPRPPQLQSIVNTVAESRRRHIAEKEQAKQLKLPAPKVCAETVYRGRAFLKAFVKAKGNIERM